MPDTPLYSADDCRELDRIAIEEFGVPSYDLMCRAGARLADAVMLRWPAARRVAIFCGGGNNGGDGYVLARWLHSVPGMTVNVVGMVTADKLKGDARRAADDYIAAGGQITETAHWAEAVASSDLLVDALFGSGLARPIEGDMASLIDAINVSGKPVLSVDIPSGLSANTGAVSGPAVRATLTITFIGDKRGLYTADGPDHAGEVFMADLRVPQAVYDKVTPSVRRYSPVAALQRIRERRRAAHKGSAGRLLVLGGAERMQGAAVLAGTAAMRSGAGLVRVSFGAPLQGLNAPADLMFDRAQTTAEAVAWASNMDALVIGPGLARDAHADAMLAALDALQMPMLLDADALNALAENQLECPAQAVLTPHPAEAARLLGISTIEVQSDRLDAVTTLARRYQAVVLLKGVGTVVGDGEQTRLIDRGTPAMAVAGMGDVLSGIIAGLLAQGFAPYEAACFGAWWHAVTAEYLTPELGFGLMAHDLPDALWPAIQRGYQHD